MTKNLDIYFVGEWSKEEIRKGGTQMARNLGTAINVAVSRINRHGLDGTVTIMSNLTGKEYEVEVSELGSTELTDLS